MISRRSAGSPPHDRVFRPAATWLRAILCCLAAGMLLSGCATQAAYRDGKELIEHDQVAQGLAKLREAINADPDNALYRQTYLQARERAIYRHLDQAQRFALAGESAKAEQEYRDILALDANNERALNGLKQLAADIRHRALLQQSEAALANKDLAGTRLKVRAVLDQDSHNSQAAALSRAIDKAAAPAPVDNELEASFRKPVSIEFKDATLKQIFDVLSRSSGLNFVFDKDVRLDQRTSIYLKNSTVEAAVNFMLLTNQLQRQVLNGNTILIYPNTAAKEKDYQEKIVKSFFLTNADAKSVANTLKSILKTRDIVVDDKLNMLIVRDSPAAIKLAEKLVALQDAAEPEVMLEVEILEVKRSRLTELGVQWPSSLSLTPLASSSGDALTLQDLRALNRSTIGASIGPVTLNANKEDGDTNLLANPRIRVRNHEKAKILIGERVPNITTTATSSGFVSESINYVDVGLKLDVQPTIYLDNSVAIKIGLEVSSVTDQIKTQSGSIAYQIGTRTADTVLRLKDGENQILAGLLNNEERSTGSKVPGLGEIPILGHLFGSTTDDHQRTEIVLSITPHLIRNIHAPDAALSEFHSGTESSFSVSPDSVVSVSIPSRPAPVRTPHPATIAALHANGMTNGMTANPVPASGMPPSAAANPSNESSPGAMPVSYSAAHLQWQGPSSVKSGDTFSVQLMMQSDAPVTHVPATIAFDPHALQVVGINEGTFLKQGGAATTFNSRLDPTGQIAIDNTRVGDGGGTNMAALATVTLRALTPAGNTSLKLAAATPSGANGMPVSATLPPPLSISVQP